MKIRRLHTVFSFFAIVAVFFAFFVFGMSPPKASNETLIGIGDTTWSLDNAPIVHGETIWEKFADYPGSNTIDHGDTIKIVYCSYWGGLQYNTEYMSWEVENGVFSSNSLAFDDLMGRWQDSESVFKFKHGEDFYEVSFSIPKLENGTYKYADLLEAWEEGELHQIIEGL
jgi:hypothetical protein